MPGSMMFKTSTITNRNEVSRRPDTPDVNEKTTRHYSPTVIVLSSVGKDMGLGTVLALIIGGAGASIPTLIISGSMFKKGWS